MADSKTASPPAASTTTDFVNFGDKEIVIAVKVDNSNDYKEEATGAEFEWMGRAFNPNYGGLNHDIVLHVTGKVYPVRTSSKSQDHGHLHLPLNFPSRTKPAT